jgi:hypothetical protein
MADWLIYKKTYLILICKIHGYAIPNLYNHLKYQHSDIDRTGRASLISQYQNLELCKQLSNIDNDDDNNNNIDNSYQ